MMIAETTLRELREFWLHVNFRCNLSCSHCLFCCSPDYQGGIPELSGEKAQNYVSRARKMGIASLYITGGEPLLWQPLRSFLDWYYSRTDSVPLVILTNGTLVSMEWAELFSRFHGKGLRPRISMECYTEETHDCYRGKGSYRRVIQGIKNLNQFQIHPWIAFVNKSGGMALPGQIEQLERNFKKYLLEKHNVEIIGLKVMGAYDKGRFAGKTKVKIEIDDVESKLTSLQCTYGLAASGLGLVACPILTDVPEAVFEGSMEEAVGKRVLLNYQGCKNCFATGSTCGNN